MLRIERETKRITKRQNEIRREVRKTNKQTNSKKTRNLEHEMITKEKNRVTYRDARTYLKRKKKRQVGKNKRRTWEIKLSKKIDWKA